MKVYTKGGDKGSTSLIGGERVLKNSLRLEAYGTIDELWANVAFLRDSIIENVKIDNDQFQQEIDDLLRILTELMNVSTMIAADSSLYHKMPKLEQESIEFLENAIDRMSLELKPITRFTIPGGNTTISISHIARTVCRRAERISVTASQQFEVEPKALMYLNRLSDYLYVIGRLITERLNVPEHYWEPEK